jgi:branched-chain amino acid transport system ATP-binding protein
MSDASPDAVETLAPSEQEPPLLTVQNLTVQFGGLSGFRRRQAIQEARKAGTPPLLGGLTALSDVSFEVKPGELFAVIGPNGAGKTSLFNVLSRVYQPVAGTITFDGKDLLRLKTHQTAGAGIARSFQNLGQFPLHTVLDYMLLGRHTLMQSGVVLGGIYLGLTRSEEKKNRAYCLKLLDLLGLTRYQGHLLGNLPFGLQKRVDLGRALAMQPKLLLLDEPVAGMGLEETEDIAAVILDIKEQLGITQILVEHDMAMVMGIADRVLVLDFGRVIAQGAPANVQANPDVIKAYLGEEFSKQPATSADISQES